MAENGNAGILCDENIRRAFSGAGDFVARQVRCGEHTLFAYSIDGLTSGGDTSDYVIKPISENLRGDTMEQLFLFEESISERINQLKEERKTLTPENRKVISGEIKEKAQQLALCRNIAKRSPQMKEKMRQIEKERNCRD